MDKAITVISNYSPRLLLSWEELTDKERSEFDYRTADDGADFFRYRDWTYDLGEFQNPPSLLSDLGWDGYDNDSFYSGVCVRFVKEGNTIDQDRIIVGRWYV